VKTLLALLTLPTLVLLVACGGDDEKTDDSTPTASSTRTTNPTRKPTEHAEPTGTPDPLATVCAENPDPGNDDVVQVDEPLTGDVVTSPVKVRGRVAAFEATFTITIYDAGGETIADITSMSQEGQTLAPFEEEVPFTVKEETAACLWVYEASPRDGLPINVLQIPIILQP
jgi:Immunoglobulin-like domain of bacterial spore germination